MSYDEEDLCEVGLFALTPIGWELLRRKKFTQMGTANNWGQQQMMELREKGIYKRLRATTVTDENPKNLDEVLAEFEEKRKAGDPEFNELPIFPSEGGEMNREEFLRGLAKGGPCKAYICIETEQNCKWDWSIALHKKFASGMDAQQWCHSQEEELLQRDDVRSCGTMFSEDAITDEEVVADFRRRFPADRHVESKKERVVARERDGGVSVQSGMPVDQMGKSEAVVCMGVEIGGKMTYSIACRKWFPDGRQATEWGRYQQAKILRKKRAMVAGTIYLRTSENDEDILKQFEENMRRSLENDRPW